MDKNRKKELLRQYQEQQNQELLKGLNTDIENIRELLDHLDEYFSEESCDDTLKETEVFLKRNKIEVESTLNWLRDNGGYCDCEVLANVEDKIENL